MSRGADACSPVGAPPGGRRRAPLAVRPVVATEIWIFAITGMALNLIFGYTGMLLFGQATFFGLAAYAAGS